MASNIQPTGLDWKNLPQKTTPISAENLNKMANTIDDLVEAVNPLNTVEANPTGTPTEGLEKVEIDGTLYEVKGGHKILNDSGSTLAQKDNLQFKGVYTQNSGDNTEVDICRTMTKAQMEALSGESLKGFINTSDEPDSLPLTTDWIETDNGDSLTDRISDIEQGIADVNKWTLIASDITNSSLAVNVSDYGELWIVPKLQGTARSAPLYTANLNTFNMGNSYREGTTYALDYIIRVNSNLLTLDYALTGWTSIAFDIYGR